MTECERARCSMDTNLVRSEAPAEYVTGTVIINTDLIQQAVAEIEKHWAGMDDAMCCSDPTVTSAYVKLKLGGYPYEVFACLFLDIRHRVLAFEELFRGSIDGASVHPREVVRHCIQHNAAAVIFAHNHPSGITEPSAADRAITLRLRDALTLIDVHVLDHLIVGSGTPTSMAQRGMI